VYRNSRHAKEATALVRFLCRRDVELARASATSQPPVMPDLYTVPEVLKARPHFAELERILEHGVAVRPSTITGSNYAQVSAAYFNAVHSVLKKEKGASEAVADLEKELVRINGFPAHSPASESASDDKRLNHGN
jgi:trehalose/maltose transport system substrate-binding protein